MKQKVIVSWSGGKDSAMAYHAVHNSDDYEVAGILTTVTEGYERISMHGIRRTLLEAQARSLGVELFPVMIPRKSDFESYEKSLKNILGTCREKGISGVVIGDIFLEDLRKYREKNLAEMELEGIFPLWKQDTGMLARKFISDGFRGMLTCVDTKVLSGKFTGREYDASLLEDLPDACDPCGENGEFHSFVYDGPMFSGSIGHQRGETVLRDGRFMFCDVLGEG